MKKFPDWFFNQSEWQEKTLGEEFEFISTNTLTRKLRRYFNKI